LRGPTWPDPEADKGSHRFSYALLPHAGLATSLCSESSVVDEAEAFNLRLRGVPVPSDAEPTSGATAVRGSIVDVAGAMVSSVKRADAGDELVVRIFEAAGAHGHARVKLGDAGTPPLTKAARTDVLERDLAAVELSADGAVELPLKPFELVTLKLRSDRLQARSGRSSPTEPPSITTNDE
jgi:alpha-mannosidase